MRLSIEREKLAHYVEKMNPSEVKKELLESIKEIDAILKTTRVMPAKEGVFRFPDEILVIIRSSVEVAPDAQLKLKFERFSTTAGWWLSDVAVDGYSKMFRPSIGLTDNEMDAFREAFASESLVWIVNPTEMKK